ncbi:MAG: hypothetical protein Ctma_0064 [Catillopecten margaritatus gill symbiont]|uniref:Uncharacterized protein n=1 Tax=Catillopecten margaritatus gill symbiont TaxID=3083288 RepID=A0AAU6PED3_9GAMM
MQWDDCDALLGKLITEPTNDWYFYDTLSPVPQKTIGADELSKKLTHIHDTLKTEHKERYCGIVYADDLENPTFVKIFHPNNLGKACGSSENPPIPQWLLSKTKPQDVIEKFAPTVENKNFISKFLKI